MEICLSVVNNMNHDGLSNHLVFKYGVDVSVRHNPINFSRVISFSYCYYSNSIRMMRAFRLDVDNTIYENDLEQYLSMKEKEILTGLSIS